MTNFAQGHQAEKYAADYLTHNGYKIVALNWRTRLCEIDIVAKNGKTVHFVEVKYRRTTQQGSGLDYITPSKLNQMQFAAECWVQENAYRGAYELSAIEVSGPSFDITNFVPNIL